MYQNTFMNAVNEDFKVILIYQTDDFHYSK